MSRPRLSARYDRQACSNLYLYGYLAPDSLLASDWKPEMPSERGSDLAAGQAVGGLAKPYAELPVRKPQAAAGSETGSYGAGARSWKLYRGPNAGR